MSQQELIQLDSILAGTLEEGARVMTIHGPGTVLMSPVDNGLALVLLDDRNAGHNHASVAQAGRGSGTWYVDPTTRKRGLFPRCVTLGVGGSLADMVWDYL